MPNMVLDCWNSMFCGYITAGIWEDKYLLSHDALSLCYAHYMLPLSMFHFVILVTSFITICFGLLLVLLFTNSFQVKGEQVELPLLPNFCNETGGKIHVSLTFYDCEDSSLCKVDCETIELPGCNGRDGGSLGCCYPFSDTDHSIWHTGEGCSVFSQWGCRGFSSWAVLQRSYSGKRGVKLEGAIPRNLSKEICARNADMANATSIEGGVTCVCQDGYVGEGFANGTGCLHSCIMAGQKANPEMFELSKLQGHHGCKMGDVPLPETKVLRLVHYFENASVCYTSLDSLIEKNYAELGWNARGALNIYFCKRCDAGYRCYCLQSIANFKTSDFVFIDEKLEVCKSGSPVVMHSVADLANQALLVYGLTSSSHAPDVVHSYGSSMKIIVWSLISAVGILCFGSGATVVHGIQDLWLAQLYENKKYATLVICGSVIIKCASLIVAKLVECLSMKHWMFKFQQVVISMKSMFVGMLYAKGLTLLCQSKEGNISGEIIKLVTVEAAMISEFCWYVHAPWLHVFQVALAFSILHRGGAVASLAYLVATIIMMLVNFPLASLQEKFQGKILFVYATFSNLQTLSYNSDATQSIPSLCDSTRNKCLVYISFSVTIVCENEEELKLSYPISNLEDKVVFKGEGNVMSPVAEIDTVAHESPESLDSLEASWIKNWLEFLWTHIRDRWANGGRQEMCDVISESSLSWILSSLSGSSSSSSS